MSENVNRLFASRRVPVIELRFNGDNRELDARIRDALKSQGINETVRYEYLSVSDFLQKFFPTQMTDENGETHTSALMGAITIVVVSLAIGTVLAIVFYA